MSSLFTPALGAAIALGVLVGMAAVAAGTFTAWWGKAHDQKTNRVFLEALLIAIVLLLGSILVALTRS